MKAPHAPETHNQGPASVPPIADEMTGSRAMACGLALKKVNCAKFAVEDQPGPIGCGAGIHAETCQTASGSFG